MQIQFSRAELSDIHDQVGRHWEALPGPTDSFLEGHVRESRHYRIVIAESRAGFGAIREGSGEFFEDLERHILAGELFLTKRAGVCVGFGVLERSTFRPSVASVGMFTLEQFRCAGVGTATIALLVEECSRRGLRPVSGCWYYNHASKRTLERAGLVSQTRLLRVEY